MQWRSLRRSLIMMLALGSSTFFVTQSKILASPAQAIQAQSLEMQARQSFFSHPPQLIRTAASQISTYTPSTYEFTIALPENAGQPLKAVKITQEPNFETIKFATNRSQAFAGNRYAAGPQIALASLGGTEDPAGGVTIVFDQPVQPGQTVTVSLEANANPSWSGVYLFGVTAYPEGESSRGQFLGYGRFHFYGNS
ncbi:DUF2808 domain-containing protein [Alkalinema pantanalense CENA528]|uniref:DUF2808 domain-containing protein n=1 Tax=Alkalinema pantanalense TaxID=1620705 RepID=UPI003D6F69B9